jgi:hypothetical protein
MCAAAQNIPELRIILARENGEKRVSMIELMIHIELSAFALAISLGLWAWHRSVQNKDALSVMNEDCFWVSVFWDEREQAAAKVDDFDYENVTSIAVSVYSASGERIGFGVLAKRAVIWRGSLEVSKKGQAVFEVHALNSIGGLLCAGKTTQTLRGINDFVAIPVGALSF